MITSQTNLEEDQDSLNRSLDTELVGVLDIICQTLEIPDEMFKEAEAEYNRIVADLANNGSQLARYKPIIYPQGSVATQTTVKPTINGEFDVDVICQLAVSERAPQAAFRQFVYDRLAETRKYRLERMNRCVRILYPKFHIDLTPGIPDLDQVPENILVTDKEQGKWKESNPKDYRKWFEDVAKLEPKITYELTERLLNATKAAATEPLPARAFSKPALNRVVQLLKRHRDITYNGAKDAPISAVIATLAAESYKHHAQNGEFKSRIEFLKTVVADMPDFISQTNGDDSVPNPCNERENYADKWRSKPQRRHEFYKWHRRAAAHFADILDSIAKGRQTMFESLSSAYGNDLVKEAATKQAEARKKLLEDQSFGITKGTGFMAPLVGIPGLKNPVVPVKPHTDFGN